MGAMADGFPVLRPDSRVLYPWVLPGVGRSITLRNDYVGLNLIHFALSFNDLCQRLNPPGNEAVDEAGYAYRQNVNNPGQWSKHAAAVAEDLNWNQHPNNTDPLDNFTRRQVLWIRSRVKWMNELAGAEVIIWGGDFRHTKDPMHIEAGGRLGDGHHRRLAYALHGTGRGKAILKANPKRAVLFKS